MRQDAAAELLHRFVLERQELPDAVRDVLRTERLTGVEYAPLSDPAGQQQLLTEVMTELAQRVHLKPGPTSPVDIHVDPLAFGSDPSQASVRLRALARHALDCGFSLTLMAPPAELVDATLDVHRQLLEESPRTAITLVAQRHRSETDASQLPPGTRVRLVRGDTAEAQRIAWQDAHEIDLAWVRCLSNFLRRGVQPLLATHRAQLLEVSVALVERFEVPSTHYEIQMWRGVRAQDQLRIADAGYQVRVILPWTRTAAQRYDYLLARGVKRLDAEAFDPRDAYWRL